MQLLLFIFALQNTVLEKQLACYVLWYVLYDDGEASHFNFSF